MSNIVHCGELLVQNSGEVKVLCCSLLHHMGELPMNLVWFWQLLKLKCLWSNSAHKDQNVDVSLRQNSWTVGKKTQLEVAEDN